ncbi:hypothetical protein ABFS82_10G112400 [Erythranthe guttata]
MPPPPPPPPRYPLSIFFLFFSFNDLGYLQSCLRASIDLFFSTELQFGCGLTLKLVVLKTPNFETLSMK